MTPFSDFNPDAAAPMEIRDAATPQHGPPKQRTRRTFQGDYLACQDVKNDDDDTTHRRREGQNPIKRRCTLIAQRPFNFVGSPPFELHMFIYKCVWAWRGSSPVPRGDFARPPAPRGSFALKGVRDEAFKIYTKQIKQIIIFHT
mgnify:FL=1